MIDSCVHTIETKAYEIHDMRIDGLMGYSRRITTLPSQLKKKNIINANVTIQCFNKRNDRSKNPSGFMAFGKSSKILNDVKINWVPLKTDRYVSFIHKHELLF